jgi:hypothetical protein
LKDGLNGKMQIIAEMPYEVSDPTIESQIVTLKASGADIFFDVATPKFAAQAIKKIADHRLETSPSPQLYLHVVRRSAQARWFG